MEIRTLRNFLRIAQLGNFSRAAEALNTAQPALSRQVRLLEEELDARLLVRHRRGVSLTEAGHRLVDHGEAILAAVERARVAVSAAAAEPVGEVGFGLPTSMIYVLSADLVERLCRRHGKVELRVHEAIGHVIESLLRDRRIDVAILISPRAMRGIELSPLVTEDIYLAGSPEAGLRIEEPVTLEEVAAAPMVMLSAQNQVRQGVESRLRQKGLALNAMVEVEGQQLALELVKRGLGHTLLPSCAIASEIASGHMSGAPITGARITWYLGINRQRAGAPAVSALTTMLRELVEEKLASGIWHGRGLQGSGQRDSYIA